MFTLRDLWHFFNQQDEDEWRQKQAQKYQRGSLRDFLWQQNQRIDTNPAMGNWRPQTMQDYFRGMGDGAEKLRNQPQPEGYI